MKYQGQAKACVFVLFKLFLINNYFQEKQKLKNRVTKKSPLKLYGPLYR